ncbi:hypothetical protein SEEPB585_15959 [Salmonella enterica subsp. enterica serovar Paratyphi B str. ATCC BAA-1585]|nr:hypothetical protein SEEPB585_15959 [Salmonella enterica subsp. enterica serovar Paratyphi B str. ATCC BAA-1585]
MLTRFIPAGAGNTILVLSPGRKRAVYPRWRGEHLSGALAGGNTFGLSPLARGTPNKGYPHCTRERFIPAGAGNTKLFLNFPPFLSVYPRWRGEHGH